MRELPESEVHGDLAVIYGEIREFCAVPYVSSLQRHVATMPGCLEYAWAMCRPAFANGELQRKAWALAETIPGAPFPKLSRPALRLMSVDESALADIRNICRNFIRVAPLNLLFAGVLERLLAGQRPGGEVPARARWSPPTTLRPMPALRPIETLDPDCQAVLAQLATELGGERFVPGLYRLLAQWPAYLAYAATEIEPLLKSREERSRRQAIAMRIVGEADSVLRHLPVPAAAPPAPDAAQAAAINDAILTYRVTSPEMIVFGRLLLEALPEEHQP